MFSIDTIWFEVAMVSMIYAIGNIFFGHFEEQTPKLRRLAKYILTLVLILSLSHFFNRTVSMISLGVLLLPVIYLHAIILPRKGINGLTGEPKEKYYNLRGWNKSIKFNPESKKKN